MELYIGIDSSSKTIGIGSFITDNNKISKVLLQFYSPENDCSEIVNLLKLKRAISGILLDTKRRYPECILRVAIEDFQMYRGKNSSANTIIKLALYNRTVALAVMETLKVEPSFWPVQTIRASLRALTESKEIIDKSNVPAALEKVIGKRYDGVWKFPFLLTKRGKIVEENFDMADGCAVAINAAYKAGNIVGEAKCAQKKRTNS